MSFNSFVLNLAPPFHATGGTITTSGAYTIHTFTTTGNFITYGSAKNIEYLVVGGGGGGSDDGYYDSGTDSQYYGGAGGGGGIVSNIGVPFSIPPGTYGAVVGFGGSGAVSGNGGGGTYSQFASFGFGSGGLGGGQSGQNASQDGPTGNSGYGSVLSSTGTGYPSRGPPDSGLINNITGVSISYGGDGYNGTVAGFGGIGSYTYTPLSDGYRGIIIIRYLT